ncbi:MAG TPA: hypothetical protein VKP11_07750, partial [Frankiaceae bacterium]|nr:hypothetical protein [Frankiaceae bacterium]
PEGRLVLGVRPRILLADASWVSVQVLACRARPDGTSAQIESEGRHQRDAELTDWLLRRAGPVGRMLPAPATTPYPPLRVAVAVPLRRLAAPGALRGLLDIVAAEHVDPSRLAIAVAETDLATAGEHEREALEDLVAAGFALELVGFTGAAVPPGQLPESGVAAVVLHPRLRQDRLTAAVRAAGTVGGRALVVASGAGGRWRWLAAAGCDAIEGGLLSFPYAHDPLALEAEVGLSPCPVGPAPDRVLADALRALVRADRPARIPAILREAVGQLGGRVVPVSRADDGVLPIDLSMGEQEACLPDPGTSPVVRLQMEMLLPQLVEDARLVVRRLRELDELRQACGPARRRRTGPP